MSTSPFTAVKIVGGLLPTDLLGRILSNDSAVPAVDPTSYGLQRGESVRRQAARSWDYLLGVWKEFTERREKTPSQQWTQLTRERWLHILLRELDFHDVRAISAIDVDGKAFPVSHEYRHDCGAVPLHLLAWGTDLDHRSTGVRGAARAPQSMLQELLNRSEAHHWAVLSNGMALRLLRDSTALVGSAYVEFDLQTIFDGELFSDFVLLYRVCHRTRFVPSDAAEPLELWRAFAQEAGTRALKQLRGGVERAIAALGTGFLSNPGNAHLRHQLNGSGELRIEDFHHALLRIVYRLLFWFVTEDRKVLLNPDVDPTATTRYRDFFSSDRIRRLARTRRGNRHTDLWESVSLVFAGLGATAGVPQLGLIGIGGIFERGPLDQPLQGAKLSNNALLDAVRHLAVVTSKDGHRLRPVDFGNLGAEELGSVYEGLLEQIPRYNPEDRTYHLESLPGNDRKETGSYYTPTPLVDCLLDATLDPLLDEAISQPTHEERTSALLDITVCDPACGSGHFLVAAARRIAKRLAAEETGDPEPPDSVIRSALRRVVGRSIYGVDINPMAAELAKISLWLEALEPGKPLAYLDANIRVGNALLGTTPALLNAGIPDGAFKVLEGDDSKAVTFLRKDNKKGRIGQTELFSMAGLPIKNTKQAAELEEIVHVIPDNLEDVHVQAERDRNLRDSADMRRRLTVANAWCAAFVQSKLESDLQVAVTQHVMERLGADEGSLELAAVEQVVDEITREYRFFHWHLEFPHIFRVNDAVDANPATGWSGGFSCILGNPPWERVKLQEQEYFASRNPEIANAPNAAARKKLIRELATSGQMADRELFADFRCELRKAAATTHLIRESGRYPLTGAGDVNTYAVFAETARTILESQGRLGVIVPTGIATDKTTAPFFRDIVAHRQLDSLLDFVTNPRMWTDVGNRRYRFVILVVTGRKREVEQSEFTTLAKHPDELAPRGHRIQVDPADLLLVNPNTGTSPLFQTQRDADITLDIYRRVPLLWRENPEDNAWGLSYQRMFDMANDSGLFRTADQLSVDGWAREGNRYVRNGQRMLPLYEAKLVHHFDHRLACYSKRAAGSRDTELPRLDLVEKQDPSREVIPRYWVAEADVDKRLREKSWTRNSLLGWRDITNATNERTVISTFIPRSAVGHKFPLMLVGEDGYLLVAALSSWVLDYVARQKISGASMTIFVLNQLPVPKPASYKVQADWDVGTYISDWIRQRVLELTYTTYAMEPFARDLDDYGPPFVWDEERRTLLRAELDAAHFHLYGVDRDGVDYIMETFPIVRRKDEMHFGEYRTKRLILEIYDAMAHAIRSGKPYQTLLDPPPAQGYRHPAREQAADQGK